jgi:ribonuclease G
MVRTTTTVAYEVLRDVMREAAHRKGNTVFVNCNPEVAAFLTTVERDALGHTMQRCGKKVVLRAQEGYHREQYDLVCHNTGTGAAVVGSKESAAAGPSSGRERSSRRRRRRRSRKSSPENKAEGAKRPAAASRSDEAGTPSKAESTAPSSDA